LDKRFKYSTEWIRFYLKEKGEDWVRNNIDQCKREVLSNFTYETFNDNITRILRVEFKKDFNNSNKTTITRTVSDKKQTIVSVSPDIKTLEDLITYAEIDMAVWKVRNYTITTNYWDVSAKYKEQDLSWNDGVINGTSTKKNQWVVNRNYQCKIKAVFERRKEESIETAAKKIKKFLKDYKFEYPEIKRNIKNNDLMLEVSIPDTHLGLLAWGEETGDANYDIKVTREKFIECVDNIIKVCKEYDISRILFPIGNDYFNVDNAQNTTFSGTVQHEDCRYQKSFTYGVEMAIRGIDMLLTIANVIVPIIPGNHDVQRAY